MTTAKTDGDMVKKRRAPERRKSLRSSGALKKKEAKRGDDDDANVTLSTQRASVCCALVNAPLVRRKEYQVRRGKNRGVEVFVNPTRVV